jgi:hypothetical protein
MKQPIVNDALEEIEAARRCRRSRQAGYADNQAGVWPPMPVGRGGS